MKPMSLRLRHLWAVIALLSILNCLVFDLRIISAPEILRVQYVPDDAYYYLTLARNFVALGSWTFDSGNSTATGFHPLLAYLLAFLYKVLQPTAKEFVIWGVVFSSIVSLGTLAFVWTLCVRSGDTYQLIFFALLVSSINFVCNSVGVMEWPLVILFSSLYLFLFYNARSRPSWYARPALFVVGMLGTLSRSDFGLLPLAVFVADLAFSYLRRDRRIEPLSSWGLAGAGVGVMLVLANNYVFSSHLLQSSARIKTYWSRVYGVSYKKVAILAFNMVGVYFFRHSPVLAGIVGLLVFIVVCLARSIYLIRHGGRPAGRARGYGGDELVALAAVICFAGYFVAYSHVALLLLWYSANLFVPLFVILVGAANYLDGVVGGACRRAMSMGIHIIVLVIIARNVWLIHRDLYVAPWPHQQFMLKAGEYLRRHPPDGKVAAWNAGIIGYYQGGHVVNIDGLVNDDACRYVINNELPAYISQQGIKYILDFEVMLSDRKRRLRGGYDDEAFLQSLQPIRVFGNGGHQWKLLTLYRVLPGRHMDCCVTPTPCIHP